MWFLKLQTETETKTWKNRNLVSVWFFLVRFLVFGSGLHRLSWKPSMMASHEEHKTRDHASEWNPDRVARKCSKAGGSETRKYNVHALFGPILYFSPRAPWCLNTKRFSPYIMHFSVLLDEKTVFNEFLVFLVFVSKCLQRTSPLVAYKGAFIEN